jgi:hypothetical protein
LRPVEIGPEEETELLLLPTTGEETATLSKYEFDEEAGRNERLIPK